MVTQSSVVSQSDLLTWFTMQGQSCASTNGVDWHERSACVLRASVKDGGLEYLILSAHLCKYFLCIISRFKHCVYDGSLGCCMTAVFISRKIMKHMFLKKRKPSLLIESLYEQLVQLQSLCPVILTAYSLYMRCCAFITVQISDVALDRFLA